MTQNSLTCRELLDFLMSYVDGELPLDQRLVFDRHLDICPDCREYLDNYRQTVVLERAVRQDDELCQGVPEDLLQAVLDAMQSSDRRE